LPYRSAYTASYLRPGASGAHYDQAVENRFELAIYRLEQWHLRRLFAEYYGSERTTRYLDFACGTGRILSVFKDLVATRTGVDTSPEQLARARTKDPAARLLCGNVAADPDLLRGEQFDLITSFRLFLNLEDEYRVPILRRLRELLAPGGRVILDNHMNRYSVLGLLAVVAHKGLGMPRKPFVPPGRRGIISTMSEREMRRALTSAGLEVEKVIRLCVLPGHGSVTLLPERWLVPVERVLARVPGLNRASKNQIFVCRAAPLPA
jgi:SAM-dependent methyltransferase